MSGGEVIQLSVGRAVKTLPAEASEGSIYAALGEIVPLDSPRDSQWASHLAQRIVERDILAGAELAERLGVTVELRG